jgi:hypothetical protein
VACPNGDLLAIWYSCLTETGRELGIAASRLHRGSDEWEEADVFWGAPDRNDHASALYVDPAGTIYHFNGLGRPAWGALATIMRRLRIMGTWSRAGLIMPEHGLRHMPIESVFQTKGLSDRLCDAALPAAAAPPYSSAKTAVNWTDGRGDSEPQFGRPKELDRRYPRGCGSVTG